MRWRYMSKRQRYELVTQLVTITLVGLMMGCLVAMIVLNLALNG